jgi:hypothetical protein
MQRLAREILNDTQSAQFGLLKLELMMIPFFFNQRIKPVISSSFCDDRISAPEPN